MKPEETIFEAARQLADPEAQAAYLNSACGDDQSLRQRIEQLLRAARKAKDFFQKQASTLPLPPAQTVPVAAIAEGAGSIIGRYKLLQKIGEGGCGVVYMAEQEEPVRRRVALKVIKLGMDTKEVIARFEAERQALALMDHPNIAKVHDAGSTDTGRPYFVMELVRGIKITDFCDENKLSTEARLKLFIQVCQAIQHAHQKGIIHRDIKPSNILVTINDGVPVPKVIDFGIAKATAGRLTNQTLFTAFEQFIGTPAYMSPEQAVMTSLDIDTRSDIYSLGVLLYELLTGRTPFDQKELLAAGLDEMRRTIREQEPLRPSTCLSTLAAEALRTTANHRHTDAPKLVHLLRGDLDWIVMKCLEKDRARRYETANGLASDIQRHLGHEPVVARPPSGAYRFHKLVCRHKGVFAGVGAVVLMLVLGVVGSTWQAVRASRAERAQERLRLQADGAKQKAQAEARLLKKMLKSAGPSLARGRDTKMMQDILDGAVRSITKELTNQPEAEVELCLTLAETYRDLGLYKQMEGVARHSLQVARTRLGEENEFVVPALLDLGSCLMNIGRQQLGEMHAGDVPEAEKNRRLQDGNLQEALKCSQEALALSRKLSGNESLDVAWALDLQAGVLGTQYRLAESETLKREALAMYRNLLSKEHRKVVAVSRELAALLSFRDDRLAETEILHHEALAMQRKLYGDDNHPEIADSLFSLANVQRRQGKWTEAEATYRQELALWTKLQAKDRHGIADALSYLAEVLLPQGKLQEAETEQRKAFEMLQRMFGDQHASVAVARSRLAGVLQREDKLEEAETVALEALASSRKPLADGNALAVEPLYTLVSILLARDKEADAQKVLADLVNQTSQGQPPNVGVLRVQSAFFARCRRWEEAAANLSKVLDLGASDEADQFNLTVLFLEMGDMASYREGCHKMVTRFGAATYASQLARTAEASLLMAEAGSDSEVARQLADRALTLGKDNSRIYCHLQLIKALAQHRSGDFASAVDRLDKTIGQPSMAARLDAAAYAVLAMAQHRLQRPDEARAALARSSAIVTTRFAQSQNSALGEHWADWLVARILLREAQALISGQIAPATGTKNEPR